MESKRFADSELASITPTKHAKGEEDSWDNLEDHDWEKIDAYLNGNGEVRREVDAAAEHSEQCDNSNSTESLNITKLRRRQEFEDQKYLMKVDPYYQNGAHSEHVAHSTTPGWNQPDETLDLNALDDEFAAFPIEFFLEEHSGKLPSNLVAVRLEDLPSVQAKSALPMMAHLHQPFTSSERVPVTNNGPRSMDFQLFQQRPFPTVATQAHQLHASATNESLTGQNTYQYVDQGIGQLEDMEVTQQTNSSATQSGSHADRPFACSQCDKTFKLERSRVRHERNSHSGRSFTCPFCHKTYLRNDGLLVHARKVHEIELPHQTRHPRR